LLAAIWFAFGALWTQSGLRRGGLRLKRAERNQDAHRFEQLHFGPERPDRLAIRNHAANQIQRIFSLGAECPRHGKYLPQPPSRVGNSSPSGSRSRALSFFGTTARQN
jgi:hypothetical protein